MPGIGRRGGDWRCDGRPESPKAMRAVALTEQALTVLDEDRPNLFRRVEPRCRACEHIAQRKVNLAECGCLDRWLNSRRAA